MFTKFKKGIYVIAGAIITCGVAFIIAKAIFKKKTIGENVKIEEVVEETTAFARKIFGFFG